MVIKKLANIYKEMFNKIIKLYEDLWFSEEYSDTYMAIKITATLFGAIIDILGVLVFTAAVPVMTMVGLICGLVTKEPFETQDNLG